MLRNILISRIHEYFNELKNAQNNPKMDPCSEKNWGHGFFFEEHDSFKTSSNNANTGSE